MFPALKKTAIALGVYKPARALHRALTPGRKAVFEANRALYSQFIKPGDIAFDVGANIGDRSDVMLSLGASVVAFEPQPDPAAETKARDNGHLTVVEKAVGSEPGTANLYIKSQDVQSTLLATNRGGPDTGHIVVPVTTLDAEIAKFGTPVFCKIDVEGFEAEVLKGLSTPIKAFTLEYHCDEQGVAKIRESISLLARLGSYEVNLIGGENASWLMPEWLPPDRFLEAFPACASPHFWGDAFVRLRH
jgi:FkbM family methyltransferase